MIPIFGVDAFTDKPFSGAPASVCLLYEERPDEWKQALAAEMNLSETAFVLWEGSGIFGLRWFTPETEVDLCGHATLATAHTLWEKGVISESATMIFRTRSGDLVATKTADGINLDFPRIDPAPVDAHAGLVEALGTGAKIRAVMRAGDDILVEVPAVDDVRSLRPDFNALKTMSSRGVIVTARSDDGESDFVSRFFAPAVGIDEDPVTGSAHCALGPYWAPRLRKTVFTALQLSKRGGVVGVEVKDERVVLSGKAVIVWEGTVAG